ncbi:MAG: hypothetical protein SF028_06085 [Candidatus Sumerlaeia bacterium]|nr:hypothetical protein [Candidatus Sumerlaeia bacterium]
MKLRHALVIAAAALAQTPAPAGPTNPVLFVTVTPSTGGTISGTYGHFVSFVDSHQARVSRAPRGGDLHIVYPDGTLRNLTAEAGFGLAPGAEICVREPNVHWSGEKAVFSMAVGGTGFNPPDVYFQLYEVSGLAQGATATITKLVQPSDCNNIQPCYASDGSIIFASDDVVTGDRSHYPPLDEYESTPIVSGLWKMNADGSNLHVLDHCPSGDFTPFVDSFGRVVFTRWDHLKRDQQADLTIDEIVRGLPQQRFPVTFDSEASPSYHPIQFGDEYFPENGRLHPDVAGSHNPGKVPHPYWDQDFVPGMRKQDFNFFFPWMINQDGTDAEVLNHLGRHEFFGYVPTAWDDLPDFSRNGDVYIRSFNQIRESPVVPGRYYGIDAAEFGTHGAGRLLRFDSPAGLNPDSISATMVAVTPPDASDWAGDVVATMFRDPMPMSDGTLWAATNGTGAFATSTAADPGLPAPYPLSSNYQFTIRKLVENGEGFVEPAEELVPGGITKSITYQVPSFWPLRSVTYSGRMWELFPVEVVARPAPTPAAPHLPAIEAQVMLEELGSPQGVEVFKQWLKDQNLAVITARDVTVRGDKQQPYNLRVSWSGHETTEAGEEPEEISYLQLLSAQYVRGYADNINHSTVRPGRRALARFHDEGANPDPGGSAPSGAVKIADDGSAAAFVPAGRAMTWQTVGPDGTPVVRERYWLTMAAGEVRSCTNCHGANTTDVFGNPPPANEPLAFRQLLQHYKSIMAPASATESWSLY